MKLAGAATSGAAGIACVVKFENYANTEQALRITHFTKASEHFNSWFSQTFPNAMTDSSMQLPYKFMQQYESLMPKNNPYFEEIGTAQSHILCEGDGGWLYLGMVLLLVAGVLVYDCFFVSHNDNTQTENETVQKYKRTS